MPVYVDRTLQTFNDVFLLQENGLVAFKLSVRLLL